ncbi:MAG: prephenate dehydrogenase [Chloroflexota bacterium]
MHIAFLGFGLIAGSIARTVRTTRALDGWTMAGWSPSGAGPEQAKADGVLNVVATSPNTVILGADIVVLAAPATDCLALIDRLAGPWRSALPADAVVTDVASTKATIVAHADAAGLRFVGGHPMAGLDSAGYGASVADLFLGRPWVVVPGTSARQQDIQRVEALADACRAVAVRLDAAEHDRAVAGISHLPLVVAAALAEAVAGRATDWSTAAPLAAGGWRDTTRVARGDPAMGAAILATNASAVAARLRDLRAVLDEWIGVLDRTPQPDAPEGEDEVALRDRLAAARALLGPRT